MLSRVYSTPLSRSPLSDSRRARGRGTQLLCGLVMLTTPRVRTDPGAQRCNALEINSSAKPTASFFWFLRRKKRQQNYKSPTPTLKVACSQ